MLRSARSDPSVNVTNNHLDACVTQLLDGAVPLTKPRLHAAHQIPKRPESDLRSQLYLSAGFIDRHLPEAGKSWAGVLILDSEPDRSTTDAAPGRLEQSHNVIPACPRATLASEARRPNPV
jgi:hypothetical protein